MLLLYLVLIQSLWLPAAIIGEQMAMVVAHCFRLGRSDGQIMRLVSSVLRHRVMRRPTAPVSTWTSGSAWTLAYVATRAVGR